MALTKDLPGLEKERREAIFSADRKYRYTLTIIWDAEKPIIQFIGLNPSDANEVRDDSTMRRLKGFCRAWGYGGFIMTNAFAFVSKNPDVMKRHKAPVTEQNPPTYLKVQNLNDYYIQTVHQTEVELTVACWGNHGTHMGRDIEIKSMITGMKCFRLTGKGCPEHPLYLPASTQLIDFN